jgi:hypothetical protein
VLSGEYPNPGFAVDMATQAELNTLEAATVKDGDAAGGVLAGTYPSPSFAVDMATQAELDAVAGAIPDISGKVDKDSVVAAATRIVQSKLAAGDANPVIQILGSGRIDWGPGGGSTFDVALFRAAMAVLRASGQLEAAADIKSDLDVVARSGAAGQIALTSNAIYFGSDLGTSFTRPSAGVLRGSGTIQAAADLTAGADIIARSGTAGQVALSTSTIYFGNALDTSLYRAAAGQFGMTTTVGARSIEVGAADSGGAGYRMLRVAN